MQVGAGEGVEGRGEWRRRGEMGRGGMRRGARGRGGEAKVESNDPDEDKLKHASGKGDGEDKHADE